MSVNKINSGLSTTTKIEQLNDQIIEVYGKTYKGQFDINEMDSIFSDLGFARKFIRNEYLGNTLSDYSNWSHIKAESGYSIWKYTPTDYLYNAKNAIYFDDKLLINNGEASSETALTFSNVSFLTDSSSYTYNTIEAGIENGTPFDVMALVDDYLYIGNSTPYYGAKFEFYTRGSGYTNVIQYWDGLDWVTLTEETHGLIDGTNSFSGDGAISWNSADVSDWVQNTVNANTLYWTRIYTSTVPTTVAKVYYLIPTTSVIGLLALSTTDIIQENWAWCTYGSSIYITLRNTGNSLYDGDYFINSSSTTANLKNFFIYNHAITADYQDSGYTSICRFNAPDASPDGASLSNGQIAFWIDEVSGGPFLAVKMKASDGTVSETVLSSIGTVTSIATDSTLTGGTITSSGTLGINLTNSNTWTGQQIFNTTAPQVGTATASTIAGFDASKNLVSLATATYPSLTELSYVKGVTSALQTQLGLLAPIASPTFTGTVTAPTVNVSGLTASQIVATDGSKNLQSLTVATYPSLTELAYVKGVTSAIQTQLNAKGSGTVTSVATAGLISGGTITTTGTITTSMSTNKLVGRGTSGTGVMEEITLGTNLSLSGTTLNATGGASATRATFTNASLTAGVLTITHSLALSAPYSVIVRIFNNSGQRIEPDSETGSTNSVAIDLTSYGTLAGTWGYAYIAG